MAQSQSKSFIRMPEVKSKTGYSKPWIYQLISRGEFPKPVKLGVRSIGFIESEVDEWIENKINASRNS